MDFFEKISRNIFIPIYNWKFGIQYKDILNSLNKSQFFSTEQIRELQWYKVKKIIDFAYNSNVFYHDHFKNYNIHPQDIKNWSDFSNLPLLTKDDIRNNSDKIISDGFKTENMHYKRTGGSTGVPVHLYVDNYAMNFKRAATHRHNKWAGFLPGMKSASLWGNTDKKYSFKEKLYMKLYNRTIYLDTLNMNDDFIFEFVTKLRKFSPKTLIGHGHSLYFFAKFLVDNKIDNIKFDGIISTAETLFDNERKFIEELFGDIVYDRYGCEELSIIASECENHEGLHINAEGIYLEVIDGDETTPGELVITDLVNKGMPFIRYKIGDMATLLNSPCSCGRGLPRIRKVFGRVTDILYTPEGKIISGVSILDTFMIHINGFKQVQIIQSKIDHIHFKIVKDRSYTDNSLEKLYEIVPKIFSSKMNFTIEFVDTIPKTARGKFQFTICKIQNDEKNKI
jgi:phenylacetate-coenzyme A ligase PaaK-like adenylate-forming protein